MMKYKQHTKTVYHDYDEVMGENLVYSALYEKATEEEKKFAEGELNSVLEKLKGKKYRVQYEPQVYVTARLAGHNAEVDNDQAQRDVVKKIEKKTSRIDVKPEKEGVSLGKPSEDPFDPAFIFAALDDLKDKEALKARIRIAFKKLKPERQELLIEYYCEGRLMREMGADRGKTDRAISQNLATCIKHLKKFFDEF